MDNLKLLVLEPALHLPADTPNLQKYNSVKLIGLWVEHLSFVEEIDLTEYKYKPGYVESIDDLQLLSFTSSTPVCIDVNRFIDKDAAVIIKSQFIVSFESKDVEVLHEHAISFKSGEKHDPGNAFFTTSVAVPALFGSHGRRTAELINKPYSDFSIDTTSYMNYPSEYVKTLVLVNKDEKSEMWHSVTYTALYPNTTNSVIKFVN